MEVIVTMLSMRFLFTLTFLSFINFSIASASRDFDSDPSLTETPQLWYTLENYNWIFQTTIDVKEISITNNGRLLDKKTTSIRKYKDFIHAVIPLTLEKENHLVFHGNTTEIFKINLFYAKSFHSETVPDDFEPYFFHASQNESQCVACHRLEASKDDISPSSPSASICYPCHHAGFPETSDKVVKRKNIVPMTIGNEKKSDVLSFKRLDLMVLDRESRHSVAVTTWKCLTCHQAEAVESNFLPDTTIKFTVNEEDGVAPLCYTCHLKRKEQNDSFSFLHGPIGMGACNMCHNPHFSKVDRLLEDKPTALCLDCHPLEEALARAYIHQPVIEGGCIVCHDPHGSNYPMQVVADIPTLCNSCHQIIAKQKNNHPVNGHPVSGFKDPRDLQLQFSCVSCHNPHASDFENLLSEEEPMMLCIQCHRMAN